MFGPIDQIDADNNREMHRLTNRTDPQPSSGPEPFDRDADLARCFVRLANLPNYALDRLSRYEAVLWRQAGQILFALDALQRRKPQERRSRFRSGRQNQPPMDTRTIELRRTDIDAE
jgi:hypothetical protein